MKTKMKNRAMLYHRRKDGAIKVWVCWVDGAWVHTKWGVLDGVMTHTKDLIKANRDGSAEQRAIDKYRDKVTRRMNKGYVARLEDVIGTVQSGKSFDFNKPLPKNFAPAKPHKEIDLKQAEEWDQRNLLYIQRKRDGLRHYVVTDDNGKISVYSSGKHNVTEHLKPLVERLQLEPRTVLDCELVVTEPGPEKKDGFLTVCGIARSLPDRAQQMIRLAQNMDAKVQLVVFDILWYKGRAIWKEAYEDRYELIGEVVDETQGTMVRMPNLKGQDLADAIEMVQKKHWEGLVLWRKDQSTMVQMNGSPDRRNCWKLKLVKEEDVIAVGFERGKGKNRNVVGKFKIALASTGTVFKPMGRCGTGLDDKTREEALRWKYPCVIQIEYDQKSEKGFRFPVFIRKRDDKKPIECRA